jgi:hypothetical protein
MTDPERRFLDHAMIENHHFRQGSRSCLDQMALLGLGHSDLFPFMVLREREWNAGYQNPFPDFEQFLCATVPASPTPCPWPDAQTFHARVDAVTLLSEENCLISRGFTLWHEGGLEHYYNEPPSFESGVTVTDWSTLLATQGWVHRSTFRPGIQRGRVSPSLQSVPISVWNPTTVPVGAINIHYLVMIETHPEPVRVWSVTRCDVLWLVGNGDNYLTIFPTPFTP